MECVKCSFVTNAQNAQVSVSFIHSIHANRIRQHVSVSASGSILTNIIMYVGIGKLFLYYLVVKMVSIAVVFAWTFVFHNIFSFRARTDNLKHL